MRMHVNARALSAALVMAIALTATTARAYVKDYEFQLVEPSMKVSPGTVIIVRLVNKASHQPVSNAVIFASRLDMAPESMEAMTTTLAPMPGGEPGTYRFKANVSMAGKWRLSLAAKVQGEAGTVETKLIIPAQK